MGFPGWNQYTSVQVRDYKLCKFTLTKWFASWWCNTGIVWLPQGSDFSLSWSPRSYLGRIWIQGHTHLTAPWRWEGPSASLWHSVCLACSSWLLGREPVREGSCPPAPHQYHFWGTCFKFALMAYFSPSWRWVCPLLLIAMKSTNSRAEFTPSPWFLNTDSERHFIKLKLWNPGIKGEESLRLWVP